MQKEGKNNNKFNNHFPLVRTFFRKVFLWEIKIGRADSGKLIISYKDKYFVSEID